jgi:2,3-bisphosphoglycerate-independent phosphoglycerate mutase
MNQPPIALIILDGFGYQAQQRYNAIAQAHTPTLDHLFKTYPHCLLKASGEAVGLPKGSIGNSEVGHLTIGAGRIIEQPVTRLNTMIANHTFCTDRQTETILEQAASRGKTIHVMGLLSDANVHSNYHHLDAFLELCAQKKYTNVIVHAFLDGRDTPPQSAQHYLDHLEDTIKRLGVGHIGSIHGRFYSMDRDHNWDRTAKSYAVLTQESTKPFPTWQDALKASYAQGITDEFVLPRALSAHATINDDDCVFFFNFRPDRARQLTAAFVQPDFTGFAKKDIRLTGFITPVPYDTPAHLPTHSLLNRKDIHNTLKEVLNDHDISMLSIAETEKYAHVTYFFNGEDETKLSHEERILIPSLHVETYKDHPEMSAALITQAVLESLRTNPKEFYLINYANADMVGHSGSLEATIRAVECIDAQLGILYNQIMSMNGTLYITGDHGNAECMFDEKTHQPNTAHTTNPVPFILITKAVEHSSEKLPLTQLSDIAPFILKGMNLPIPAEMTE